LSRIRGRSEVRPVEQVITFGAISEVLNWRIWNSSRSPAQLDAAQWQRLASAGTTGRRGVNPHSQESFESTSTFRLARMERASVCPQPAAMARPPDGRARSGHPGRRISSCDNDFQQQRRHDDRAGPCPTHHSCERLRLARREEQETKDSAGRRSQRFQ